MPKRNKGSKATAVAERPAARKGVSTARTSRAAASAPSVATKRSWRQRLKEFRFLSVILGASLALALYESSHENLPKTIAEVPPDWLMDERVNMARTLTELYPERSYGHFLRGYQAAMCWDQRFAPAVCDSFPYKDLRDVRSALEEAIAHRGLADQEELYHFYAFILARSGESPEAVDQAIGQWRRHYPHSKKPDPRQMAAASAASDGE